MEGYGRGQQVARRPLLTPVSVYMSAVGGSSEMTDLRPKRANDSQRTCGSFISICKYLAENHIDMAFGPILKLGHTLEASLFIHCWRLEVIARHPNPADTPVTRFRDKSIQQCACVSTPSISFIDPDLSQFRNACPRITGSDADHSSQVVVDHET
jgi:hypothetical protein